VAALVTPRLQALCTCARVRVSARDSAPSCDVRAAGTSNALMEMFVELMLASVLPLKSPTCAALTTTTGYGPAA